MNLCHRPLCTFLADSLVNIFSYAPVTNVKIHRFYIYDMIILDMQIFLVSENNYLDENITTIISEKVTILNY